MRIAKAIAFTLPFAALPLTACGGGGVSMSNATPEEVAQKVEETSTVSVKPGEWETTIETVAVDIPGVTEAVEDQMAKSMFDARQVVKSCITEEQAKKPAMDQLAKMQDCTYEKYELSDGKLDSLMTCKSQGNTMTMHITGNLGQESFTMENNMEATMPGGVQSMKVKAKLSGRYLGACPTQTG